MHPLYFRHTRSAALMMAFFAVALSISLILGPGAPGGRPGYVLAPPCNATTPPPPSLDYMDAHYSQEAVWNYCWTHAAEFNATARGADARRSRFTGVQPTVTAGELITWRLEAHGANGSPLGRGGDSVAVMLRGPSLVRPRVYDLRNGTYVIAFALADAGQYTADVSLRWRACRAHILCSVPDVRQPIDALETIEFEVIGQAETIESHKLMGSGRWVAADSDTNTTLPAPLRGDYVWAPWGAAWGPDALSVAHLHDRWVHFIGDSLSEHAWAELIAGTVAPACEAAAAAEGTKKSDRRRLQGEKEKAKKERKSEGPGWAEWLVDRYTGERMEKQLRRDGMRLWRCAVMNITLSFVFYPDMFPVSGSKTPRFPLINETANEIPAIANVKFRVEEWTARLRTALTEMDTSLDVPLDALPDAVVFNFGLHFASQLDPPLYALHLRHMMLRLLGEFPDRSRTALLWRSTGWTHFEETTLPEKWNCRTPVRTQILNEVARRVVEAAGVDATVDFEELTAARGDATPDNRHFSRGNVRATYNAALLRTLADVWEMRERLR